MTATVVTTNVSQIQEAALPLHGESSANSAQIATSDIGQGSINTSPQLRPSEEGSPPRTGYMQRRSKHKQREDSAKSSPMTPRSELGSIGVNNVEENSTPRLPNRYVELGSSSSSTTESSLTPPTIIQQSASNEVTPQKTAVKTSTVFQKQIKPAEAKPYLATDARVSRWHKQELNKPLAPAMHFEEYYDWNAAKTKKSPSKNVRNYNNNEQEFHNEMIMLHSLTKELDQFYHIGNTEKTKKEITEVSWKGSTPVEVKKLKPVTVYTVPVEVKHANGKVIVGNMEWCVGDEKNCYHRYLKKFHSNPNWHTEENPSLQHMDATYFKGRRGQALNTNVHNAESVSIDQDLGIVRIKDLRLGVEITAYAKH